MSHLHLKNNRHKFQPAQSLLPPLIQKSLLQQAHLDDKILPLFYEQIIFLVYTSKDSSYFEYSIEHYSHRIEFIAKSIQLQLNKYVITQKEQQHQNYQSDYSSPFVQAARVFSIQALVQLHELKFTLLDAEQTQIKLKFGYVVLEEDYKYMFRIQELVKEAFEHLIQQQKMVDFNQILKKRKLVLSSIKYSLIKCMQC
ncbi:unnamed protein product (macronuclear) [Paramecium tetraurelia]|uniref:Uncharacterized protein n=1 Tax=Paramecium tetraurelia TaxID=5888 RepID=A0CP08_PARTE|nr:uncharacterized protein GSPATT00038794001 [Paramecium tetraurelia]CAK72525.1 unnamed protein product [Paramecium tetraurelia]|eukprot:XP_001439922.1 hypothetical protein (macronuclear) [Paramecium tetraurelia strain d4-2]